MSSVSFKGVYTENLQKKCPRALKGIMIMPVWPTQTWLSKTLQLHSNHHGFSNQPIKRLQLLPACLSPGTTSNTQPGKLMMCHLSGSPSSSIMLLLSLLPLLVLLLLLFLLSLLVLVFSIVNNFGSNHLVFMIL